MKHSIRYPGGRKVLNPWIRDGWPRKRVETRSMTPGVSMLQAVSTARQVEATHTWPLNSFITSRKRLYTFGWSENWIWERERMSVTYPVYTGKGLKRQASGVGYFTGYRRPLPTSVAHRMMGKGLSDASITRRAPKVYGDDVVRLLTLT